MKGMPMRCQLPLSDTPSKYSDACGPVQPAEIQIKNMVSGSLEGRPGRSPAMCWVNPAPWKIGRTEPQRSYTFPDDRAGKQIALVSRLKAMADVEEMNHDLHQARENFTTIFRASPAILCIIQLNRLRYREINKVYEQRTGYSRSEVLGKASIKLGLWNTVRDRERVFQKLLAKGGLQGHHEDFQT